jgi:hypothetical protein
MFGKGKAHHPRHQKGEIEEFTKIILINQRDYLMLLWLKDDSGTNHVVPH